MRTKAQKKISEEIWHLKMKLERVTMVGGRKKKQVREKKEIIVLECHEKAQVVLDRRDMEQKKEEDGDFFGEVLQRRSNFTLSN